jgi:hypothetical protein
LSPFYRRPFLGKSTRFGQGEYYRSPFRGAGNAGNIIDHGKQAAAHFIIINAQKKPD